MKKFGVSSNNMSEYFGVSSNDMSEYADHRMGKQMKDYFDNNPEESELYFTAEI